MFLCDLEITTNADAEFRLYAIGDMHSDRREFNERRFKQYRQQIMDDPFAVAVCVGDTMEGRTPGMKHFDVANVRPDFLTNMESYVKHALWWNTELLKPIVDAGRPLVILEGNHDRYQEYSGYAAMLADRCGAHYLGGEGFIRVRSGQPRREGADAGRQFSRTTVIYATHGHGGGRMPGSKINEMQQSLNWLDTDVVIKGHVHDGAIRVIHRYGVTRKGAVALEKRPVVMYRAPSFVERSLPGLVNYAGRMGYPSTDDGLQYVTINPVRARAVRHELEAA